WWDKGLIHQMFPQWVASLDYSHYSRWPHDPNKMEITAETPETRKALNKQEWVQSYYEGAKPSAASSKQTMIAQYAPFAAIILVVLVGFFLYTNMQSIQQHLSVLENTLNAITR
ncbi:hypothetical protein LCGC14_3000860, partial [marine sediment metagenome]